MNIQQRKLIMVMTLCAAFVVSAVPNVVSAAAVSGQGTWESTLQGRDLDGNLSTAEAYYDTDLNITWLADANAAVGSAYDWWSPGSGLMYWTIANTWANNLNINGVTGWRLPTTVDVGNNGCSYTNIYQGVDCGYNITTPSEMSHLYYTTLGDKAYFDTSGNLQAGYGLTNTGPFSNVRSDIYWSATEYAPNISNAWFFSTAYGGQDGQYGKDSTLFAWAVHSDDVGTPIATVPTTVNTGYRKPTANRPDGGGDWNGYEISPANAYVADGISAEDIDSGSDLGASCTSACKDRHRFYNFGFNIPAASHITGLEVRLKANADSARGSPRIFVQVSWDGGVSWTARMTTKVLGTVLANYRLGTSTDTWGRTWSANDFSNANFRVRLIDESNDITSHFGLDNVAVRVTYY